MVPGASGALPSTQAGGTAGGSVSAGGGGSGGRASFAGMGPDHEHESQGGDGDGDGDGGDRGFGGNPLGFGGFGGFGGAFPLPVGSCTPESNFCIICSDTRDCPTGLRCSDPDFGGVCVQPCGATECGPEFRCDKQQNRCSRACATSFDCSDNRVCDQEQQVCVQCLVKDDCERLGDPELRACDDHHRCVECETNYDCMDRPDRRYFCVSSRCTR